MPLSTVLPGADDADAVAQRLDLGEDVAGQQHGRAVLGDPVDLAVEHLLHERVEAAGRLVEEVQLGRGREGGDERDLLPVALRVRAALLARIELERLAEPLLARAVVGLVGRAAPQAAEQVDRLAAGEVRPDRDVARHVRDATVQCGGLGPRVAAEERRLASRRTGQPQQDAERGGLPGAVRSEEAVDLAGVDREVESVEGDGAPEPLLEASGADDGVHERDATPDSQFCESP